jgi:cation transport ATPase
LVRNISQRDRVLVATAPLFTNLGLSVAAFGDWPQRLQQQGQQVLFVAVDGRAAGFIGVIDQETGDRF